VAIAVTPNRVEKKRYLSVAGHAMTMSSTLSPATVASAQQQGDFSIKPETVQPVLSTAEWPLLLKNYDKLLVRSGHFTPIPSGCSPLKRDITSYIKSALRETSWLLYLTLSVGLVLSTLTSPQTLLHMKLSPGSGECCESKRRATAEPLIPKLQDV
jgi:hypothetical protein